MANNYPSAICSYCECTGHGRYSVNTGPHNICEGRGCEDALENYNESVDDEDKFASIEDAF